MDAAVCRTYTSLCAPFSLCCCQAFGCSLWVLTWSRVHHEVGRFKPIYYSKHVTLSAVKAKRELKEQASTLLEFRKLAEESERREKAFSAVEQALKVGQWAC